MEKALNYEEEFLLKGDEFLPEGEEVLPDEEEFLPEGGRSSAISRERCSSLPDATRERDQGIKLYWPG